MRQFTIEMSLKVTMTRRDGSESTRSATDWNPQPGALLALRAIAAGPKRAA